MNGGVFQKVRQHLLDQQRVHGHQKEVLRQVHPHVDLRIAPPEFAHSALNDLLRCLWGLGDPGVLSRADAGDGQEVLHNVDEPLGLLVGVLQQLPPLLRCQVGILLQQNVGGPHNACQRGADIVGYGPQKVAVDLFPLSLPFHLADPLGPAGNDAGGNTNNHHHQKRQREAGQREADLPIRRGEDIVHTEHCEHGDGQTEKEAVRQQSRQEYVQQKDHGHIAGVVLGIEVPQHQAADHRHQIQRHGHDEVLSGIGQHVRPEQAGPLQPLPGPADLKVLQGQLPLSPG